MLTFKITDNDFHVVRFISKCYSVGIDEVGLKCYIVTRK